MYCNREERWDIFLFVQTDFTDLMFTGFEPISFQFEIKEVKVKNSAFQAATTELKVTVVFFVFSVYTIFSPETTLVKFLV